MTPKPPKGGLKKKRDCLMNELNKNMYFRANPGIFKNARLLRKNMTEAEKVSWEKLSNKQLLGLRFRRQHPIDIFIADFYCHQARLVIEIDGPIHNDKEEYDNGREADIEKFGLKILRFTNKEILSDIDKVLSIIEYTVKDRI